MTARAAVYLRVSTDKQSTENQEPAVLALLSARGWAPGQCEFYRETVSATAKVRPEFDRMMDAGRRGEFSTLFIWSLDRFGRSMFGNLRDLTTLGGYGVGIVSVKESWLDTTEPMLRKLLLAIFSWVAEHEHQRLKDRTRAGLAHARAAGKTLGRPKGGGKGKPAIPARAVSKAAELRAGTHRSWRDVAAEVKRLGFGAWSHATIARECTKRVPSGLPYKPPFVRRSR